VSGILYITLHYIHYITSHHMLHSTRSEKPHLGANEGLIGGTYTCVTGEHGLELRQRCRYLAVQHSKPDINSTAGGYVGLNRLCRCP
jgi:hypothetical protein